MLSVTRWGAIRSRWGTPEGSSAARSRGCPTTPQRPTASAAAVLCALVGCRSAPVFFAAPAPWEVRRPQLQAREHFDLSGRVAVAAGHEGFNANLHWEQQGTRSQLMLEGPLGTGAVQISAT